MNNKQNTFGKKRLNEVDGHIYESSGEYRVSKWLRRLGIKYVTQMDTLKCINPVTGNALPYDFELIDYKIIIEVQGEQHYKYKQNFHGNIANFEYQKYKDKIKKDFALKHGYKYLELKTKQTQKYKTFAKLLQEKIDEPKGV